jgi:hypothetical protein
VQPEHLYRRVNQVSLHQGAICGFSPVAWFEPPPLWVLREIDWDYRSAELWQWEELSDAFSRAHREEWIAVSAKVRTVIVLSNDAESRNRGVKELVVAPVYTLDRQEPRDRNMIRAMIEGMRPESYFLPRTPLLPTMGDAYINFRKVHPMHRDFLEPRRLPVSLSQQGTREVLDSYARYLQLIVE